MSGPHALLLSGSLGMGHDVMAQACAASLEERGWTTQTANSLALMGDSAGGLGERVFRGMLAVPGVYDAFHFEQLRAGGRLARLAETASSRTVVPALTALLDRTPSELVVSVFATGAAAASRVKRSRPGLTTAVFCTDACPHALWVHDNTDLYLVTSRTARGFITRFHPGADTVVVPTPVRPDFYAAPTQADARAALNLPPDEPCALLMAGAWGIGPVAQVARELAAMGVHTLAVAGRNAKLQAALTAAAAEDDRLVPFGFTDRIPTLMAAADVVITSSGDTCSEARTVGRRLLLLDVVPGHGRENLQLELERGDADVLDPDCVHDAVRACLDRVSPPTVRVARTAQDWQAAFDRALARVGLGASVVP